MFGIFGLLLIPAAYALEKADMKKKGDKICREKGYANYAMPNSDRVLQNMYFVSYVQTGIRLDPTTGGRKAIYAEFIHCIPDNDGKFRSTNFIDRYRIARIEFEERGYYWDKRYDPFDVYKVHEKDIKTAWIHTSGDLQGYFKAYRK